ncbi:hypothetical protein BOTBODRAFT_552111 [Botryobasidium botryosum FD-172 SS1]|uniref:Putative gamma-glutamylcyclotransferase n=1 Tax=Botryobasidium botryosum (strain FD-172 SS1) TaxID=930990 RepID=A0A067MTY0_BOTB1|nr:hypothetical protein BOTBODRAFT_552111 [Botryobasidium botryosum FD-172 SS1]
MIDNTATIIDDTPAFFYGTLMHPSILKHVLVDDGAHIHICGAILPGYSRRQVLEVSFPAIIPWPEAVRHFGNEETIPQEEQCVRGTLVYGLTDEDRELLDDFENGMYSRERVAVHALGPSQTLKEWADSPDSNIRLPNADVTMEDGLKVPSCEADTYVWCDSISQLSRQYWYEDYLKENLGRWI